MTDIKAEFRARLLVALDLTEEDMAAFEATPQQQSYRAASEAAEVQRAAYLAWAHEQVAQLSVGGLEGLTLDLGEATSTE